MNLNQQLKKRLKTQNTLFVVLFLSMTGLLAYITQHYSIVMDWSSSQRHSLSSTSQKLLATVTSPIDFTVFVSSDSNAKRAVSELVQLYQRSKPSIKVQYVDPALEPDLARKYDIKNEKEMIIRLAGKTERLIQLSEESISNAIHRLSRANDRWLLFVEGHGERKVDGIANHDYGEFGKHLESKGFKVRSINLAETSVIPLGIAALVIASPQLEYLAGEIQSLKQYIQDGGNLLWLLEPDSTGGLEDIASLIGITLPSGTIIDPNARRLVNADERVAIVTHYLQHAATRNFKSATLFPKARGLIFTESGEWKVTPLLQTLPGSWLETSELKGQVEFNQGIDSAGPIDFALTLERKIPVSGSIEDAASMKTRAQRVLVMGDGDFLANNYLGNGGNLDLGIKFLNWLSHDDRYIEIPARTIVQPDIVMSKTAQGVLAFGFVLGLPVLLGGSGFLIWLKRRRQ